MGVTRILDLIVIMLLATVLLMPRPDASVKPALTLDPERRARVAELQSTLIGRPDAVDASVELANIFLDGHRPDWALATVDRGREVPPERLSRSPPARDRLRRSVRGRAGVRGGAARGRAVRRDAAAGGRARVRRRRAQPPRAAVRHAGRGVEGRHEEAALPGEGPHLQVTTPDVHPEAEGAGGEDGARAEGGAGGGCQSGSTEDATRIDR